MQRGQRETYLQKFSQQALDILEGASLVLLQCRLYQVIQNWSSLSQQDLVLQAHAAHVHKLRHCVHHCSRQQHTLRRCGAYAVQDLATMRRWLADIQGAFWALHQEGQQSTPWCLSWQAADAGSQLTKLCGWAAVAGKQQQNLMLPNRWKEEAVCGKGACNWRQCHRSCAGLLQK